uniref:Uncharacterized protein n=1 Tax=Plectus sambesii TaxID=2011161 RepID=A0A914X3T1_9BILA
MRRRRQYASEHSRIVSRRPGHETTTSYRLARSAPPPCAPRHDALMRQFDVGLNSTKLIGLPAFVELPRRVAASVGGAARSFALSHRVAWACDALMVAMMKKMKIGGPRPYVRFASSLTWALAASKVSPANARAFILYIYTAVQ